MLLSVRTILIFCYMTLHDCARGTTMALKVAGGCLWNVRLVLLVLLDSFYCRNTNTGSLPDPVTMTAAWNWQNGNVSLFRGRPHARN